MWYVSHHYIKAGLTLLYDGLIASFSLGFALLLRYDFALPEDMLCAPFMLIYGLITGVVFYYGRLYRNIWHYTTAKDLIQLGSFVLLSTLFGALVIVMITRLEHFPRSVLILTPLIQMALSTLPRFILRLMHDRPHYVYKKENAKTPTESVLLIGVNDTADIFMREAKRLQPPLYTVLGVLDSDTHQVGRMFHGVPILDVVDHFKHVVETLASEGKKVQTILLTEQKTAPYKVLIEQATSLGLSVKRIPHISQLKDGDKLTDIKPVLIEDLLGRHSVDLDLSALSSLVQNKTILVTGAGGSIGSELCRQILMRKPAHLICLDHSENALYHLEQECSKSFKNASISYVLGDVKSSETLERLFSENRVDLVCHAAAYKHVPMVEENPIGGIENNVLGTGNVVEKAIEALVPKVIIISTDKAVNPTNVMGATKRAAEAYALWLGQQTHHQTQVVAVRFGNVLGSNGSVIPLFKRQLLEGGPLTVTHKDVTRYFMTIPEAVQLVLKTSTLAQSSELFMLNMGDVVRIWDLAEQMIRLSGLEPYEDIDIIEIGLRPGEKLFEELSYNAEMMDYTESEQIYRISKTKPIFEIVDKYKHLAEACVQKDAFKAVQALQFMIPEYAPSKNSLYFKGDDTSGEKTI